MHDITALYYCNPYDLHRPDSFIFGRKPIGDEWGYSNEIIVHLPENVEYVGDEYFYGFTVDDKPVYRIIIWRNPRNSYDVRPQLLADDSCPVLDWKYKE